MVRTTILLIFFLWSILVGGQNISIEIDTKHDVAQAEIISLGENGVIHFFDTENEQNPSKKEKWLFTRYDTVFNELWSNNITLDAGMKYVKHDYNAGMLFLLFHKNNEFQIIKIDPQFGEFQLYTIRLKRDLEVDIEDFKTIGAYLYIGGNQAPSGRSQFFKSLAGYAFFPLLFIPGFMPERSAFTYYYDTESNSGREIPAGMKGYSSVTQIYSDSLTDNIHLVLKNGKGSHSKMYIQEFGSTGIRIKSTESKPFTSDYQLLDGRLNRLTDQSMLMMGTYGRKNNNGSQGIYFSKFTGTKQNFIQYNSFTKFKHFFSYLHPRDQDKIKKKIDQKKKKGKELNLNYELLLHDIMIDSGRYIMAAESYFPQYHREYRTVWIYGRPVEQSYEVFDGWRYTHAIIAGFDSEGRLLWDNYMPIQDIISFNLNEKIKVFKSDSNRYIMAYQQGDIIKYNIVGPLDNKSAELKSSIKNNENFTDQYTDLLHWYGYFYIRYSIQKNDEQRQRQGTKFYLTKTRLKPDEDEN